MNRKTIYLLLSVAIVLQLATHPGCRRSTKQPINLDSLRTPVPYSREAARISEQEMEQARAEEAESPRGKVQQAAMTSLKIAGIGVVLVASVFLWPWLQDDDNNSDIDALWRQGYGYNNPNNERIKNGQPPLNFDGSVSNPKNIKC